MHTVENKRVLAAGHLSVAFIHAHTIVLLIAYGIQPELCVLLFGNLYNGVAHLTLVFALFMLTVKNQRQHNV
ncbi:hypothetical protein A3860_35675 [Niastella vici]|uniref:Uncharacterized protein n=1 Tax=Niastella vici TaxID=1703345 RepID=A0A1V9FNL5_9BACT|nr:hypothetical protein A3860_35675 [Niastella vici]